MKRTQSPCQDDAIVHGRVEQAKPIRPRRDIRQFRGDTVSHDPAFIRGVGKDVEPLALFVKGKAAGCAHRAFGRDQFGHLLGIGVRLLPPGPPAQDNLAVLDALHEVANTRGGLSLDPAAARNPVDQFAIVHSVPPEGAFGNAVGVAKPADVFDQG